MQIFRGSQKPWQPASHEDPEQPGVWKRVLAVREDLQPGRIQMVNWSRLPVGASFQPHYHEDMQEIFVMVRGSTTMVVNGVGHDVSEGDLIVVDAMEVHEMHNNSTAEALYIVFGISAERGGKTVIAQKRE